MSVEYLKPITSTDELNHIKDKVKNVITALPGPDDVWMIKQVGWVAVPCESADHFDDNDASRLLQAVTLHNQQEMIAIALESLGEDDLEGVIVPATLEALEEFDRVYSFYWCILYSGVPDWLILCTKLNYFVVAGPKSFVETFLGCRIDRAFDYFHDFLMEETYAPLKEHLNSVYQHLLHDYPKALPGQLVILRDHS